MSRGYRPRRCSRRWLDGDCPPEVLCIIRATHDDPAPEKYDVLYTAVDEHAGRSWLTGIAISANGRPYNHFELETHKAAAYRYRSKGRYVKWTDLPEGVQATVRRDIKEMAERGSE